MTTTWRIGTRGSALALWQANTVKARLEALGVAPCEIVVIKTDGDRLQDAPLSDIGGKRLFVKEIEDALLDGEIDLAVHSAKDMAVVLPIGLHIAGVLPRADARDAVVLPEARGLADASLEQLVDALGRTPRIGTSSVRRVAQLHRQFPGAEFLPVRGNVDTRLRKLDDGAYEALVLAAAGLQRLDRGARISGLLPVDVCIPAPGQGIVAVECREDAEQITQTLVTMSDPAADIALRVERALVATLGGGCQLPLGAHCRAAADGGLELLACVTSLESEHEVRAIGFGDAADPEALGEQVAERLLADGAGSILDAVREYDGPVPDHEP
jgi:hydroxymethylbilane synthase